MILSRQRTVRSREALYLYVFIAPGLLGFLLFYFGPMLYSLWLSFTEYQITSAPHFIGLDNYQRLIHDPLVATSLKVTTIYALVGVPIRLFLQLFIAILLNRKIRGITLFRAVLYLPSVVAGVAMALIWMLLFNPYRGVINDMLWQYLKIEGPLWIKSTQWVLPSFLIMSFWTIGPGIVIDLAALQGIPEELYEAAVIDGAGAWRKFRNVTLPLMTPILLFNTIMGIIANFQVFTQAYVMTGGGPGSSSLFYVLYLYRNAFQFFKMGYAAALSWLLFAIILVLTLLVIRSSSFWVFYSGKK